MSLTADWAVRYGQNPVDGIGAHRDQSFYRIAVIVFSVAGSARVTVLDQISREPVEEWDCEPGDMSVLAGGGLGSGDRRPLHRVGPAVRGTRVSVALRMRERHSD